MKKELNVAYIVSLAFVLWTSYVNIVLYKDLVLEIYQAFFPAALLTLFMMFGNWREPEDRMRKALRIGAWVLAIYLTAYTVLETVVYIWIKCGYCGGSY